MSALVAERERLRLAAREAQERLHEAKRAHDREWELGRDLLAPLWDRRYRGPLPTDELRRFTDELVAQVRERGLAFDLSSADRSLIVFDPAVRDEHAAARDARDEAARELRAFERDHADALAAEERAAEAQQIRDALAGDDPEAIRRTLAGAAA